MRSWAFVASMYMGWAIHGKSHGSLTSSSVGARFVPRPGHRCGGGFGRSLRTGPTRPAPASEA